MSEPRARHGAPRRPCALYVIILVAFQVFLVTVAVEAFQTDNESLAWATAGVSVVAVRPRPRLPALPAAMTAAPTTRRTVASTRSRRCSPATSRS